MLRNCVLRVEVINKNTILLVCTNVRTRDATIKSPTFRQTPHVFILIPCVFSFNWPTWFVIENFGSAVSKFDGWSSVNVP